MQAAKVLISLHTDMQPDLPLISLHVLSTIFVSAAPLSVYWHCYAVSVSIVLSLLHFKVFLESIGMSRTMNTNIYHILF